MGMTRAERLFRRMFWSREELQRDSRLYASPEREAQVRRLVERRMAGEPVAYLIGEWEFYGLPLDIFQRVIPIPGTGWRTRSCRRPARWW